MDADLARYAVHFVLIGRELFGDFVRRAGIATLLERAEVLLADSDAAQLEPQQRVPATLEELGPTF